MTFYFVRNFFYIHIVTCFEILFFQFLKTNGFCDGCHILFLIRIPTHAVDNVKLILLDHDTIRSSF